MIPQRATRKLASRFAGALLAGLALVAGLSALPAEARVRPRSVTAYLPKFNPDPLLPDIGKDAAIVIDGASGRPLYERDADAIRYPASLTKIMTLYLLFDALHKGEITLSTPMNVSTHAAEQEPTKLNLLPGETIPVETAIKAIVVLSANDVAVVIAEALGITEGDFAEMMNAKARQLGMTHTHFHNASGLPDAEQTTTAHDLAILGRHVAYDFPQYYPYFSTESFSFKGRFYGTHNNLVGVFAGTDGIKTGYTKASGFNLVTSVVRGSQHLIGVVMGGKTAGARDKEMEEMLADQFARIDSDPTLVAEADVPWHTSIAPRAGVFRDFKGAVVKPASGSGIQLALNTPPAAITATPPVANVLPQAKPELRATQETLDRLNTASTRAIPADNVIGTTPPAVPTLKPALLSPNVTPVPKPAQPANVQIASYQPPQRTTILRDSETVSASRIAPAAPAQTVASFGEGDIGGPDLPVTTVVHPATAAGLRHWSVQIGAFEDQTAAKAQLVAYAERSMDVLGQAQRLVVPFASANGKTLYRARFGLFAENEARQVCKRMTERGQTCFTAVQAN
jgi:D-alanyl-D-alanine carboxypeptidase